MNTARKALLVLCLFSMFAMAGAALANGAEPGSSTAPAGIADVATTGFHAPELVQLGPVTLGPYVYDGSQNVTQIGDDRYQYDAMNRLQSGTAIAPGHPGNTQQFKYDGFGNLQKVITSNAPDLYIDVDQSSNHLRDVAGTPAGTGTYTWGGAYDEAGNQLQLNGGASRYDYDALNAMVALRNSAGRRQFYLYDADGERLATIDYADASNATWHYTARDLNGLVVRTLTNAMAGGVSTWQWKSDNIYRESSLLASVQSNGLTSAVSNYHIDHLGSPVLITNEAHEKTAQYRFWPFGGEALGSTVDTQPMKFTGHERDSDGSVSALDYMHARFYSSLTGRFLSVDPRNSAKPAMLQSWNRYAYALNNPLKYVDPDGQDVYIVVTNAVVDDTRVNSRPGGAGVNETVPAYRIVMMNQAGDVDIFAGSRDSNYAGKTIDTRGEYGSRHEAPPGSYFGKIRTGGRLGPRIELSDTKKGSSIAAPDGTERNNIQIHVGPGCSEGCVLLTGGKVNRDAFMNSVKYLQEQERAAGRSDQIHVVVQPRNERECSDDRCELNPK